MDRRTARHDAATSGSLPGDDSLLDPGARVLVVVAHPDDEAFWFTPVLRRAAHIVAALPVHTDDEVVTRGRERVLADYPIATFEFLPFKEAGVYRRSNWRLREPAELGVTLRRLSSAARARAYRENYETLLEALDPYVRAHEVVFSHNPWGEYGHEEHVQVSSVVTALARRHGRSVWVLDGLPARVLRSDGMRLRSDFYEEKIRHLPRTSFDTDLELFRSIRHLYESHLAWTGSPIYEPPQKSEYVQLVREGDLLLEPGPPVHGRILRVGARALALDGPHRAMRY
ncbi:MAG: PIG-L family deacetylase, partial [Acidimicrobiales bacterium]